MHTMQKWTSIFFSLRKNIRHFIKNEKKKKYQRLEIDKNIYIIKNIPQNVFFLKITLEYQAYFKFLTL